jgi:extracellular factor (EF) 3-hydroxypalmitic acid methyl ester biosynthesis protein
MSLKSLRNQETKFKVRQDRHVLDDLEFKVQIGDQTFLVYNFSYFGLAIDLPAEVAFKPSKAEVYPARLTLEGAPFQSLKLRFARESQENAKRILGFQIEGQYIDVDRLFCSADAMRQLKENAILSSKYAELPEKIKFDVYELKTVLESLRERVLTLESNRVFGSVSQKESFESAVIDTFGPAINEVIVRTNLQLQSHFEQLHVDSRTLAFEFFREQLKSLIYESIFADRSYKKPRGYAGDYEMMNMIYRNDASGASLFSRCMEKAMQLHPEPGAVRNRVNFLKTKILGTIETFPGEVRVMAVACGPSAEIRESLKEMNPEDLRRIEFHLLDQDDDALKEAERGIKIECIRLGLPEPRIILHQRNIKAVIQEGLGSSGGYDLIYSAGLFDYFTDPVARKAAEALWNGLNENGKLVIGNFNSNTPNRFGMLSLFDWYLILRSETQMKELYSFENSRVTIEAEPNEINIFSVIDRSR